MVRPSAAGLAHAYHVEHIAKRRHLLAELVEIARDKEPGAEVMVTREQLEVLAEILKV